ncbi:MAG: hypothetical protein ABSD49_10505 [Candidatus Bathyarchaeia archaeon]
MNTTLFLVTEAVILFFLALGFCQLFNILGWMHEIRNATWKQRIHAIYVFALFFFLSLGLVSLIRLAFLPLCP